MTSNFTSTASAGALRYRSAMKNSDQPTDARAADTVGEVEYRVSRWGSPAVPTIRQNISARKLRRVSS